MNLLCFGENTIFHNGIAGFVLENYIFHNEFDVVFGKPYFHNDAGSLEKTFFFTMNLLVFSEYHIFQNEFASFWGKQHLCNEIASFLGKPYFPQ